MRNAQEIEEELKGLSFILSLLGSEKLKSYLNKLNEELPTYFEIKQLEKEQGKTRLLFGNQPKLTRLNNKFNQTTESRCFKKAECELKEAFLETDKKIEKWLSRATYLTRFQRKQLETVTNHNLLLERIRLAELIVTAIKSYNFKEGIDVAQKMLTELQANIASFQEMEVYLVKSK